MSAPTPGYNSRLEIFFTTTKTGKPRAWYFSRFQFRAFPLPYADAEIMRATGTADILHCHPMRACEQCRSVYLPA